jgi:hypothetical protein
MICNWVSRKVLVKVQLSLLFKKTVKHFTDRGSTVYAAALDATKAFDRVNHGLLFRKLQDRNVPPCLINTLACW